MALGESVTISLERYNNFVEEQRRNQIKEQGIEKEKRLLIEIIVLLLKSPTEVNTHSVLTRGDLQIRFTYQGNENRFGEGKRIVNLNTI